MRSIIFLLIISFTGVFILPLPGGSILQKIPILLMTILIVFKKELKIYREYKPVFTILIVFLLYSFLSSISFTNSLMSSFLLVAPYILLISIFLILSNLKYETLDLNFRVRLSKINESQRSIGLGIRNLFNEQPPRVNDAANLSYDPKQHDPLGRVIYASFNYQF